MAQPTKEQWDEVAKKLDFIYGSVYLRCDGHVVTACLQRIMNNKLGIVVYVNGWSFRGDWLPSFSKDSPREMSDEARKFWMPKKHAIYTKKQVASLEKIYGKRAAKKRGVYDHYSWAMTVWNRPLPFIRHLKAHNDNIDIIDENTYQQEVVELQGKYK